VREVRQYPIVLLSSQSKFPKTDFYHYTKNIEKIFDGKMKDTISGNQILAQDMNSSSFQVIFTHLLPLIIKSIQSDFPT